jgi:hypothetical protein
MGQLPISRFRDYRASRPIRRFGFSANLNRWFIIRTEFTDALLQRAQQIVDQILRVFQPD